MGDQSVDERSRFMAGRRMNHKARRLVDNDEMRVLMNDVQRNVLGSRFGFCGGRKRDGDDFAQFDRPTALNYGFAVHLHLPFSNEALKARAADIMEALAQNAIEALTGFGFGDGY
jgi:hypothetical protein